MSQPTWITPAGSLGVIPEGVFYQQTLLGSTDTLPNTPTVTASNGVTDRFTCSSLAGIYPHLNVTFTGTTFGGVDEFTRYFVLEVFPLTNEFTIAPTEFSTTPTPLTTATGSMVARFTQHIYYHRLQQCDLWRRRIHFNTIK